MKCLNLIVSIPLWLAAIAFSSITMTAQAQPYWKDSSGDIVHNSSGECWRTSHWTAETALAECEGGPMVESKPAYVAESTVVAVKDTDGDGINDNNDRCPDTASGIIVDGNGCAKDSDRDGVIDSKDDCPATKRGQATNNRGCDLKDNIDLSNIQFDSGTSNLNSSSQSELNSIATVLKENSHLSFEIAGHTDNSGSRTGNINLSQKRANAVRSYLLDRGVTGSTLTAKGYGPDKPVADNNTREGRASNRRVELVLQ